MLGLLHRLKQDRQHRDYLLICVGCFFGLRAKDLLALKWCDLYNEGEVVNDFMLTESKTGKRRHITINPSVKEALNHIRTELTRLGKFSQTDYLFANRWGGKISISYVNRRLHKIFELYNVKVQNGSTHTLRKSFGKRVFEMNDKSESSLIYLSEIFGHSSIATTKRYIGITQQVIANVYLKL